MLPCSSRFVQSSYLVMGLRKARPASLEVKKKRLFGGLDHLQKDEGVAWKVHQSLHSFLQVTLSRMKRFGAIRSSAMARWFTIHPPWQYSR